MQLNQILPVLIELNEKFGDNFTLVTPDGKPFTKELNVSLNKKTITLNN